MFDPYNYRPDFPLLERFVHDQVPLVYLDNAATSQKPNQVIDAISDYYRHHNANVHRGVHQLGDESTQLFHQSRKNIAAFFGAVSDELIVVRNTTEAINQVMYSWAMPQLKTGQTIIATQGEHHSNLVPWQELARQKQLQLVHIPILENGRLDIERYHQLVNQNNVGLLVCGHVSNALGTLHPVEKIAEYLKTRHPQAKVLIDGAQAAPHLAIHFDHSLFDFYAVSAHKMLGPMGIGGLLVKKNLLSELSPFLFGGGMINQVSLAEASYAEDPEDRYTAGTPDVAGLVGWAAACEYLKNIGMTTLQEYDQVLVKNTIEKLAQIPEVQLLGLTAEQDLHDRVGAVTFLYKNVHAHDVGQILDFEGVAVRTGHHCTMPLHTHFGWPATVRVSFQLYNTVGEVEVLVQALSKVKKVFNHE